MMISFSVIIPCYQDEERLVQLLEQLQKLPHRPTEIIVVDGANSQTCRDVCTRHGVCWLASEPCRGRQLSQGAALAQGEALWFLHVDVRLSVDPLAAMGQALAQGAVGGYFRFYFDAPRAWPALILEPAIALRSRFGVPYGDQGIFAKRDAYFAAGGHAPWPLFEEVPLVKGLRGLGHFQPLLEPIWVDSRRWQRDGWWRRTWHNRKLAIYFACGMSPAKLAEQYRARRP
ncbi:TIGR04283 family arsenosugar biosynthesis glycosyltransferase [Nitrosomonas sp. Nm132]|jgi:rSAM/selenodomain-associated transferase 2|uniref:TIGR04283 family arsenosugar biosynthesis glycosyltransferase n=1 Tax=Nitrosomonas sp. Nm132 TaxID=1881053 RepID=UPI000887B8ED|nr:TIGR04283 family arsenosugar biosynthesis glycosyltransferase [Nitrosomonas sp. Nm132]SDH15306.1 transferase 2, rSAM/selenodomain-associated [Nitrosomonas sp. Nm132]